MQAFLAQSPWSIAPLVQRHQRLVADSLGEADGVLLVDESGIAKQGFHSVGVARQYCGALGKGANCQVDVYVGYASRIGYSLLDTQLFVPESWFTDAQASLRSEVVYPKTCSSRPHLNWHLSLCKL